MNTRSLALVTCPTNSLMAEIHDRMPVIIALESRERCAANIEPNLVELMVPYLADPMAMWPISSKENSPGVITHGIFWSDFGGFRLERC
jgi:putative SOS response-associated peptidase YedK